jgi:hypothetical protein
MGKFHEERLVVDADFPNAVVSVVRSALIEYESVPGLCVPCHQKADIEAMAKLTQIEMLAQESQPRLEK